MRKATWPAGKIDWGLVLTMAYVFLLPLGISYLALAQHLPRFLTELWTEQAAGWAQTLGAVAAIFGAVWLQDRQRRLDEEARGAAELDALALIAISASLVIGQAAKRSETQKWTPNLLAFARAKFAVELESLASINVPALPNRQARANVARLRMTVLTAELILDVVGDQLVIGAQPPVDAFAAVVEQADNLRKVLSELNSPQV